MKYEKSKSWIFLGQLKNGSIQAIGSSARDKRDNTIEVSLDVGEYIALTKVAFNLF